MNIRKVNSSHILPKRVFHECSCFLNLLNELRKRDKMRGSPSILSLFDNEFDKFNMSGARMLDSIYHIAIKIHKIAFKMSIFAILRVLRVEANCTCK